VISPGAVLGDTEALASASGLLDFEQTVPRWMTHRRSVSEVFVCGTAALDGDVFAAAVQLPRAHALWADRAPAWHDPLLAVEAGRQATIALAHAHFGLGRELMMVARSCDMRVRERAAFRDDGRQPLEGIFLMRAVDRKVHNGVLVALGFAGELHLGETSAMEMSGTLVFTPMSDYELLRAHSRARKGLARVQADPVEVRPIAPRLVGRECMDNVVIGASDDDGFPIIVRPDNPRYFDHPLDHVPGQLLMEACRQNAIATAVGAGALTEPHALVTAFGARFDEFAELDAPCTCIAGELDRPVPGVVRTALSVRQLGHTVGAVEIELTEHLGTNGG
jgi:hypothetical protein